VLVIPRPLRDRIYAGVARRRYRWFGKREQCMVPTPAVRLRFID
jgi:predicted DCC family thiol-disulfide oxidoreductase YuxK